MYQKLYKTIVEQHSHLDWEEFNITLSYDIAIIEKFMESEIK